MTRDEAISKIKTGNATEPEEVNRAVTELQRQGKMSICIACCAINPSDVTRVTHDRCGGYVIWLTRELPM